MSNEQLYNETLIPLANANSEWRGPPVSRQAWWRYALKGLKIKGEFVKLETIMLGRERMTSKEAILRFVEAQNASRVTTPKVTPAQRKRQGEAAMKQLEACGV